MFTAHIDDARATVRAHGRLDPLAADLLHGTLQTLQRRGHRHITVDMRGLAATRTADRHLLTSLIEDLAAGGTRLTLDGGGAPPSDPAPVPALPIRRRRA